MSADLADARDIMVDSQVRPNDVPNIALQDAMRRVPRETLVPADKQHLAYADAEVPYAPGRWLLRPRNVSKLLFALHPHPGGTALAISAPYAGAVLEALGLKVTLRDAADAAPIAGTYDVIVCEGAIAATPPAWRAALAPGGRLAVVERQGPAGRAVLYMADGEGSRVLFDCTAPIMEGFASVPAFVF